MLSSKVKNSHQVSFYISYDSSAVNVFTNADSADSMFRPSSGSTTLTVLQLQNSSVTNIRTDPRFAYLCVYSNARVIVRRVSRG